MEVTYSIGSKFAGVGIGNTAYHAVRGIYRHDCLKRLFCLDYAETEIDKRKIENVKPAYFTSLPLRAINRFISRDFNHYWYTNCLYDFLVSKKLDGCEIFHGWNNHSLRSSRRAKELGAITIIERASSHPLTQDKLLQDEYKKFDIKKNKNIFLKRSCNELEECSYITVPSDFVKESFLERDFSEEKLIKIPFGVDIGKYKPIKKENDKFIVLFVGQIMLRKGVQYLLKAWEELNLKNAELRICGASSPEFKNIIEKYRNRNSIKFLGFVSSVEEEFKNADIFCFPSIEEGSALVTYEAMAAGLPLITTYNSGSVARDGKDGFVISIRDVKIIKDKIQYFYNNVEEIKRMGRNARKQVENYSWERYGDELVKAYEEIR